MYIGLLEVMVLSARFWGGKKSSIFLDFCLQRKQVCGILKFDVRFTMRAGVSFSLKFGLKLNVKLV